MSFAYVMAPAYNNINFVLMIFPTVQSAANHLEALGLVKHADGRAFADVRREDGSTVPLDKALDETCYSDDVACEHRPDYHVLTDRAQTLRNGLFADGHYYGGCGECSFVVIKRAEYGDPLVSFDLD